MDEASKLFTGVPEVFSDLVDFALKGTGFKVVRGSLIERNAESIARLRGMRAWFKKVSNDVVAELQVTDGDVTTSMLVVLENQTSTSAVMAGRSLMSTAVRWDVWRREMKHLHRGRKELKTSQEMLDGVLPGDRMMPVMVIVVHFGQEAWTGLPRFTDTLDCPPSLKPKLADCPVNVISFYNLPIKEINKMPQGALRAVTKSIRYAKNIPKLLYELKHDKSFDTPLDEMYDIISIVTGLNLEEMKKQKEKNMQKKVSAIEQYLLNKGEKRGEKKGRIEEKTRLALKVIQNWRNRHIPESQILEDLQSDFELDEATASQYMAVAAKA